MSNLKVIIIGVLFLAGCISSTSQAAVFNTKGGNSSSSTVQLRAFLPTVIYWKKKAQYQSYFFSAIHQPQNLAMYYSDSQSNKFNLISTVVPSQSNTQDITGGSSQFDNSNSFSSQTNLSNSESTYTSTENSSVTTYAESINSSTKQGGTSTSPRQSSNKPVKSDVSADIPRFLQNYVNSNVSAHITTRKSNNTVEILALFL